MELFPAQCSVSFAGPITTYTPPEIDLSDTCHALRDEGRREMEKLRSSLQEAALLLLQRSLLRQHLQPRREKAATKLQRHKKHGSSVTQDLSRVCPFTSKVLPPATQAADLANPSGEVGFAFCESPSCGQRRARGPLSVQGRGALSTVLLLHFAELPVASHCKPGSQDVDYKLVLRFLKEGELNRQLHTGINPLYTAAKAGDPAEKFKDLASHHMIHHGGSFQPFRAGHTISVRLLLKAGADKAC